MTTQSKPDRDILRLNNLLTLGIGLAIGTSIALLLLGPAVDYWSRSLAALAQWMPPPLRQALANEASTMGLPLASGTSAYWYMSRGAGLVGYLLLWGAAVWGLLVSTKVAKDLIPAPLTVSLHEFLSLAALAFASLHALVLLGDRYIDFGLVDIVYPFAASYRPAWVGLGQLGFYLSAALTLSFYLRKSIGPKTWRWLHYLTFLAYGMVLAHVLGTGTDTSATAVQAIVLGTAATIVFLVYYRLLTSRQPRTR